jgi:hypothetical protein
MPDVTPNGEDRRRTQYQDRTGRTPLVTGGQEAPATTAEMRGAFVEETRDARDARGARAAGEGGEPRGATTADTGAHGSYGAQEPRGTHASPLLPNDECDTLAARIQHAVAEFVDRPRDAVEEADHVLEELTARFTDAVNSRRRTLRGSWQLGEGAKDDTVTTADTEQLRLALRDYRELTERLLHM